MKKEDKIEEKQINHSSSFLRKYQKTKKKNGEKRKEKKKEKKKGGVDQLSLLIFQNSNQGIN